MNTKSRRRIRQSVIPLIIVAFLIFQFPFQVGSFSTSVHAESTPGMVEIDKSAVVAGNRLYNVTLKAKGTPLPVYNDIILVLDQSASMSYEMSNDTAPESGEQSRWQILKSAADRFVNSVLSAELDDFNRIAVVTYSGLNSNDSPWNDAWTRINFSNNPASVRSSYSSITPNGGTNVEAGFMKADDVMDNARSEANKYVILMSDGQPTFYYNDAGYTVGNGSGFDTQAKTDAIASAFGLQNKHPGTRIFTIGICTNADQRPNIIATLNPAPAYQDAFFEVNTASDMDNVFSELAESIESAPIVSNAIVKDYIETGFSFVEFLSVPAGTVANHSSGVVTWSIGNLSSIETALSFRVRASDEIYGAAYTNDAVNPDSGAELTFTPVPANPVYPGPTTIAFPQPSVPVPPIAIDDEYSVIAGSTININQADGLLKNDLSTDRRQDGGSSTSIQNSVTVVAPPAHGSLTQNGDGSFTYVASLDYIGDVTYSYEIKTIVDIGGVVTTLSDTAVVTIHCTGLPLLSLDKTADITSFNAVSNVIQYSYKITNTGNVTLNGPFTVTDDKVTVTVPATASLAPGAFVTGTASHTVTQADLDAGSITNVAQAFAGELASNTDSVTVTAVQSPAISLDKSADIISFNAVGDIVQYSYKITNTGNVTLNGPFTVTDDKVTVTVPATASLAPGASVTGTASHTVTQADLDAGSLTNVAQAFAGELASNTDSVTVTAVQSPAISLDKSADIISFNAVGDIVQYSYKITNTGNVTLNGPFTVTDDKVTVTVPATASLAPGASVTGTASHTVTQADLDAGSITNVAQAFAGELASNTDSVTVTAVQSPEISLDKTADVTTYDAIGDIVQYSYKITNTGNITLNGPFTITDDKVTVTVPATASLAPGAFVTGTASHTVTQADLDAGSITNIAQAFASELASNTDSVTVTAAQFAGLGIDKQVANLTLEGEFGDYVEFEEGEVAIYRVIVTNVGNVTLNNVMLSDDEAAPGTEVMFGEEDSGAFDSESKINLGSLAPGESITLYYTYETRYADIARSPIENTATASAAVFQNEEQPEGQMLQVSDSAIINVNEIPLALSAINITKQVKNQTANGVYADMANGFTGDVFTYLVTITNTGDTLLSDVVLTDDMAPIGGKLVRSSDNAELTWVDIGGKAGLMIGELEAGESVIYTYQYKSLASDEGEVITNVAAVSAVFKPVREGYEDVPLADDDSAAITVVGIPITGETDNNSLFAGLALILAGVVALILRRRHGHQPMDN